MKKKKSKQHIGVVYLNIKFNDTNKFHNIFYNY